MSQDNLRHAQYGADGVQVDDPQNLLRFTDGEISSTLAGAGIGQTRPVRCATFGPSHAELNSANTDISLFVGAMGAGTPGINISPERWQVATFYPNSYLVANGGKGGETTAQMLTRATLAASATRKSIQDIIDLRPDVVFLASLDTNDFAALTPANYRTEVDNTIARHRNIVQQFISAGVFIIEEGNYPYSASTHTYPALTRQAVLETSAVYAADAAQYPEAMKFIPACYVLGDLTGNWLPNCSQNDASPGLHKSLFGEWKLAQARADALKFRFGTSRGYRYAGKNLLTNAALGTAGNNSLIGRTSTGVGGGLYATGWTHGANGNLVQNLNAVQIIDGKKYSTMLGTSTAASAQQSIYFPLDAAAFTLTAGDIVGLEFDMYVSDANDGPPPAISTMDARFNLSNGSQMSNVHFQNASGLTARSFPGPYKAHVVCQPIQLPTLGALTLAEYWFEVFTNEIMQWKLGGENPRLVKIGSGGVLDPWQI